MSMLANPGLVNPNNMHDPAPSLPSKVGPVAGCHGSVTSPDALNNTGIYRYMKKGGARRHQKKRKGKGKQRGGFGYGFTKNQEGAILGGPYASHSQHYGNYDSYADAGQPSDLSMGAYKQYSAQMGGGNVGYGNGGRAYYTFDPKQGADLQEFAGSGYPPIKRVNTNQCGGRKKKTKGKGGKKPYKKGSPSKTRKGRKDFETNKRSKRYSRKSFKGLFGRKTLRAPIFPFAGGSKGAPVLGGPLGSDGSYENNKAYLEQQALGARQGNSLGVGKYVSSNQIGTNETPAPVRGGRKTHRGRKKNGKRKTRKQKGGYSQYLNDVAYGHGYASGAPPSLNANDSALANPSPHKAYNNCRDTWVHKGSE